MKYTDVLKLPLNTPLVLHTVSSPYSDITKIERRYATFGVLVDYENRVEKSWTGSNGNSWAFDPNHRGMPPINTDTTSRTKRHLIAIVDPDTGVQSGEYLLVMPKNILGLYSEVKDAWEAQEAIDRKNAEEKDRIDALRTGAIQQTQPLVSGAEASVRKTADLLLGRDANFSDIGINLKASAVFNADQTSCRGKVEGEIRMSYDLYLRFMEYVYESVDAQ